MAASDYLEQLNDWHIELAIAVTAAERGMRSFMGATEAMAAAESRLQRTAEMASSAISRLKTL